MANLLDTVVACVLDTKRTRSNVAQMLTAYGPNPYQPKVRKALQAAYDADEAAEAALDLVLAKVLAAGYTAQDVQDRLHGASPTI